jgi:hypothetical protein
LASIFTIFSGDECDTVDFLKKFSIFSPSLLAWPITSVYSQRNQDSSGGIPYVYSCSSHLVETILEAEEPSIFSAFTLSGCTPSQV